VSKQTRNEFASHLASHSFLKGVAKTERYILLHSTSNELARLDLGCQAEAENNQQPRRIANNSPRVQRLAPRRHKFIDFLSRSRALWRTKRRKKLTACTAAMLGSYQHRLIAGRIFV